MQFLKSRTAQILTLVLLVQLGAFYGFSRSELSPANRPLSGFPKDLDRWQFMNENLVDQETRDVLKADDLLSRTYGSPAHQTFATLFIAYFRSQRTGKAPHSPKNCLPGNGWVQEAANEITIHAGAAKRPIQVNEFLVAKGDNRSMVTYWYHSRDRVVASEYKAKFFVVADALRYNRTDTSLVRVIVPVDGKDYRKAIAAGRDFVNSFFDHLADFLPQ